jgi:hypothetical protein
LAELPVAMLQFGSRFHSSEAASVEDVAQARGLALTIRDADRLTMISLEPKMSHVAVRVQTDFPWVFSNVENCLCNLFSFGGIEYWQ